MTSDSMSEEDEKCDGATEFDLDKVLDEIKMGKYQIYIFLLISLPIFIAGVQSSFIFTAGQLNYRCSVPECEGNESSKFHEKWLNNSMPFDEKSMLPEKCEKFRPILDSQEHFDCQSQSSFNRSDKVTDCSNFVYEDDELTILKQFNLNCAKEYYLSIIGTINNIGQLFCYAITGILSDKYGRKIVLILGTLGSGLFGILRVFATNYTQFAVFEFLDAAVGSAIFSTAYIIALELVTAKHRTIFGILLNCFYAFGNIYLGIVAMIFRNYKLVLILCYTPAVLTFFYFRFLPQSIRWLLITNKRSEAKRILLHAAKFNNSILSEQSLSELDSEHFVLKDDEEKIEMSRDELRKSRIKIVTQLVLISWLWFSTIFVYYGLNINSVYLEYWDKYINFIIVCSIELPGYFMTNILMEKLGRKKTLFIGMIGSGIFCILSEFLPGKALKTILFIAGKLSITISFSCLYIFTVEVFPTSLRHRLFSICAVIGRIGGILTPLTPLLAEKSPSLPLIIFSALSLSSSIFLFALPETLNKKLPDTIKQATS